MPERAWSVRLTKWVSLTSHHRSDNCYENDPKNQALESTGWMPICLAQKGRFLGSPKSSARAAAADSFARLLCAGFALALLVPGCASPRPLKSGKAVMSRTPTGIVEQT
jgi:hypothetical protein